MNNKQKEVLQHHRHFLLRNVVWTDDLANKMLAEGLITDLTMKEIQGMESGRHQDRKKLLKVLDALPLRGESMFVKFCDLLHMNGHPFIADLLRDDEAGNVSEIAGVNEIFKRVPALDKLKEADRRALEFFIIEKAKETSLKASWSKDAVAREKYKAIRAMEKQLEDAFEFEVKQRKKNEEIEKLKVELKEEQQKVTELRSEIQFIKSELQTTETKMRNDFGVQMKFSMANENALRKLTDKYDMCSKVFKSLDDTIKGTIPTPARTSEREQMAIADFPFAFIQTDLDSLVSKYHELVEVRKQYEAFLHERNYVLNHLGVHEKDEHKPSLLTAYRDFAVRTDEDLTDLRQKLDVNTDVIEGQKNKIEDLNKEVEKQTQVTKMKNAGTAWQNALLNVMRKQLNDVKLENRKKDTKLNVFESEISKLKSRIAELESKRDKDSNTALVHGPSPGHKHSHGHAPSQGPVSHHTNRQAHLHVHTHAHSHISNHVYNLNLESTASRRSSISPTDSSETRKRNSLLPPLGGKEYPVIPIEYARPNQNDHSQKRQKIKIGNKYGPDPRHNAMNSLITPQLKIENKGIPVHAPIGGKYSSRGLGEVKNKYAWKA